MISRCLFVQHFSGLRVDRQSNQDQRGIRFSERPIARALRSPLSGCPVPGGPITEKSLRAENAHLPL